MRRQYYKSGRPRREKQRPVLAVCSELSGMRVGVSAFSDERKRYVGGGPVPGHVPGSHKFTVSSVLAFA